MSQVDVTSRVYWRDPFGKFLGDLHENAEQLAYAAALRGAFLSRVYAPKRTLRLVREIGVYRAGRQQAGWKVAGVPYAAAQEEGARPHQIGQEGQILGNKKDNFGPIRGPVHHPGNPATHFMERAREEVARQMITMAREQFKR